MTINYSIIEMPNMDGTTTEHVIIDRGNDEYTSMPKATYDQQQAMHDAYLATE